MNKNALKEKFDENAEKYDKIRELIIPCFDDLYNITTELANSKKETPKILDLGAGTGLLTKYLFEKYPDAEFTLVDLSEEMLKVAKSKFKAGESKIRGCKNFKFLQEQNNFKYVVADYSEHFFDESYDLVISSLSIHHLEDDDKKKLYKKVYSILNKDGIFLNADQVIGPTLNIEKEHQRNWIEKINANNFSESEKEAAIERMKFDTPATLEDNLEWLQNSGFEDVDIYYKYYNFCIFYGKKSK